MPIKTIVISTLEYELYTYERIQVGLFVKFSMGVVPVIKKEYRLAR